MTKPRSIDGLNWRWQVTGGQPMLVTDGGGTLVILAPGRNGGIMTRDAKTGILRKVDVADPVAKMIAATPEIHRAAKALINGIDIGVVAVSSDADETLLTLLSTMRNALAQAEA